MPEILESIAQQASTAFLACREAIESGTLIERESSTDKEFPFQNWFKGRLEADFDEPGRNTYPDIRLVHDSLGFEVKGLAYPGRDEDYDCNSQIPHGVFRGRQIVYVFGRYPKEPDENSYAVYDLVLFHGSFLNAQNDYVHRNTSVLGMGSYGDIRLRDRKMYVAPTPFGLLDGVEGQITLVLPEDWPVGANLAEVGRITRVEADQVMTGYAFDLETNRLTATFAPNPTAGNEHKFVAYRREGQETGPAVSLKST